MGNNSEDSFDIRNIMAAFDDEDIVRPGTRAGADVWTMLAKQMGKIPSPELDEPVKRYDYKNIAETLMRELVSNEIESHVLLKDDTIRDWWASVLREDKRKADEAKRKEEARLKKEQDKNLKNDVLSRLTADEKRVLGLK